MKKFVCFSLMFKFCSALNVESAMNYNLTDGLVHKQSVESVSIINSKAVQRATKKIAVQTAKPVPAENPIPETQYLHKKARKLRLQIKPDPNSIDTATINYDNIINGLGTSEYKFLITESTAIGVKQNSLNLSHFY